MKTNLKQARKDAGYTQGEVSEITGIALGTLRRWEQGVNEPDMGSIIQLARLYRTSTDAILGSEFSAVSADGSNAFTEVPLYGSIAAGTPIEMLQIDDTFPVPTKVHDTYPDAFLLKVVGSSMNRILPDGCYALVNPCEEVEYDNKPYAVCVNGHDATIKRVHKLDNGFELVPDSTDPTFKAKVYDYGEEGTEKITIIGRVVYHVIPFDWSY